MKRLFTYAGSFRYLTIASWILSVISAWHALVPFYLAVAAAVGSMLIYIIALMCSHIAAFRVQANMRLEMMRHILTLPMGVMDREGSGRIRKIVNESSEAMDVWLRQEHRRN